MFPELIGDASLRGEMLMLPQRMGPFKAGTRVLALHSPTRAFLARQKGLDQEPHMAAPLPHSKPPADGLLPEGKRGPGLHLRAGTARDRRAIVELGSSLFAPFGEYRQALNG